MTPAAGPMPAKSAIDMSAAAMMVFVAFTWGLNYVAVKLANVGYNPIFAVLVRSVIGGALVLLWCRWRGIALFVRDKTLLPGLAIGVLFGAEFALVFAAFDLTTAARGTLMFNTMPFWVAIGGHFFLGERIGRRTLAGLVLAFTGMALVFSDKLSLPGPDAIRGDLMCILAGVMWACITLVIKRSRLSSASAEKTLLYQLAFSVPFVAPFIPFSGPVLRDVTMLATGALLFQAVVVVAFTYVLWFWLVRHYPASGLSSFTFLTPAFGVVLAGLLLDEPLSARIFLALALIAAGLTIVNRPVRRKGKTHA